MKAAAQIDRTGRASRLLALLCGVALLIALHVPSARAQPKTSSSSLTIEQLLIAWPALTPKQQFIAIEQLLGAGKFETAGRLLETNQHTLLGDWLARNPLPGWVLFNGTMYLEAFALVAAFRPRLHRVWGMGLIVFHLGTQVAMGFSFEQNIVLVGLLLVCSPWAPETVRVGEVLGDLPGVRFVLARFGRGRVSGRRRRRSPP